MYIDADIFSHIQAASTNILPYLYGDVEYLKEQKKLFLSNSVQNPQFRYNNIPISVIENKLLEVNAGREKIKSLQSIKLRNLYREVFDDIEIQLFVLKELHNYEYKHATSDKVGSNLSKYYGQLYEHLTDVDPLVMKKIDDLKNSKTADYNANGENETLHTDSMKNKSKHNFFISYREVEEYLQNNLNTLEINDWKLQRDKTGVRNSFSVNYGEKALIIPTSKNFTNKLKHGLVTRKVLDKIIAHEIKTHVIRGLNGYKTKYKILGFGLRGYKLAEEGIALLREDEIERKETDPGFESFLALSLCFGLDRDGRHRDFREVFNFMKSYYASLHAVSDDVAIERSWSRCVRVFRGTVSNSSVAHFYTKDLNYYLGYISVKKMRQHYKETECEWDTCKFDITNANQVHNLVGLGVLDKKIWRNYLSDSFA